MDTNPDIRKVLGFLTDEERFRVAAAVSLGAADIATVSALTGYANPVILKALVKLEAAGLVVKKAGKYYFEMDKLKALPEALGDSIPKKARAAGLDRFIRDGRLITYPKDREDRILVLDYLAGLFEHGQDYTEQAVNDKLKTVHEDFASLRRYLIDHGYLEREHTVVEGGRTVTVYRRVEQKPGNSS